jgi:hypothetical protein
MMIFMVGEIAGKDGTEAEGDDLGGVGKRL